MARKYGSAHDCSHYYSSSLNLGPPDVKIEQADVLNLFLLEFGGVYSSCFPDRAIFSALQSSKSKLWVAENHWFRKGSIMNFEVDNF